MSAELRRPQAPATRPGSDRDGHVVAVRRRQALVVDPFPAFGEVTEVQRAAGRNRYRGAAGAVRAPPQRVGEGIPVIEVADYRHRAVRLIVGQCEGNADGAVLPRPGCLDQLLSPVSALSLGDQLRNARSIIAEPRAWLRDLMQWQPGVSYRSEEEPGQAGCTR